jgi:hypothetical protein
MKKVLTILVLISVAILKAEDIKFIPAYFLSYPQTVLESAKAPLGFERKDWLFVAATVGVGAGLYLLDEDINKIVLRNRNTVTKSISYAANKLGEKEIDIASIGGMILSGYVFKDEKTLNTGLLCMKSALLADGLTTTLKFVTQRYRPRSDMGNEFWNGSGFMSGRDSFPSGHSTVVWSIAPIFAEQYKDTPWVAPVAYGLAGLTSYARLHDNAHWASDVFAGAVIGYLTAKITLVSTPRFQFVPDLANSSFCFVYQF